MDYGAVGDNSTDDLTAIGNAIAALPAGGGTVYFPAKIFKTSDTIIITGSNITLLGSGGEYGGSAIRLTGSNRRAISFTTASNPSGNAIRHLSILGPGSPITDTASRGVYALCSVTLEDCHVGGFYDGVYLDASCFFAILERCSFDTNTHREVYANGNNNLSVAHCNCNGGAGGVTAIEAVGCHNVRIRDNVVENYSAIGVIVDGKSSTNSESASIILDGNYFELNVGGHVKFSAAWRTAWSPPQLLPEREQRLSIQLVHAGRSLHRPDLGRRYLLLHPCRRRAYHHGADRRHRQRVQLRRSEHDGGCGRCACARNWESTASVSTSIRRPNRWSGGADS